ncbi:MAG TPA: fibro-slime domain-containing protein [Polyangia bacterium]|jgi:fibro-slime domain-containing protein|nr:fibro-slime domain-containing protein [Polyangia bacterium]
MASTFATFVSHLFVAAAAVTAGCGSSVNNPFDGGGVIVDGGPRGFVKTEAGGFELGAGFDGEPNAVADPGIRVGRAGGTCHQLLGVVRDFKGRNEVNGHPDFESYTGSGVTPGLIGSTLGADHKPIYASRCEAGAAHNSTCPYGQQTTSKAAFDQWYRGTPGVNKQFFLALTFDQLTSGISTFQSQHFFPLDGQGWGTSGLDDNGFEHNFGFTTELHTTFTYGGGETFTFSGDDDLWVFINGHLAIDLGGLHLVLSRTVSLDASASALGISKGSNYPLDLFHAERHTNGSHFRVDTNFVFVDCGVIIP